MSWEHKFKPVILEWMLAAEMSLSVQVHVGPKPANTLYFSTARTVGEPRLRITQSEAHQLYNSLLLLLLTEYL